MQFGMMVEQNGPENSFLRDKSNIFMKTQCFRQNIFTASLYSTVNIKIIQRNIDSPT